MWWDHLPASAAFCDVETTGLGNHDRIVSFGAIGMISRDTAKGRADLEYLYLVFDPGRAKLSCCRTDSRLLGFGSAPAGPVRSSCCRRMALPDIL